MLDGSSPPVQTIIFENTNYKSTPIDVAVKSKYTSLIKNQRPEKCKGMLKYFKVIIAYSHGYTVLPSNDFSVLYQIKSFRLVLDGV